MSRSDVELLRDLGRGASVESIERSQAWTAADFERWWQAQLASRQPSFEGSLPAAVGADVSILRDERGIPHCFAHNDADLFVAYGFCMARDRAFHLDTQRRKGHGRLAALIGTSGIEHDRVAHTIGFPELIEAEFERLDDETRSLLESFAEGVELAMATTSELPIEYALLGASWGPWTARDSIASTLAWRWQFTGRPHVYAGPELLKRALGDDALVAAILAADREADTATIPSDSPYPPAPDLPGLETDATPVGGAPTGDTPGSNNWVMSGHWSRSGKPLVSGDPHMPYEWSSAFYEVGLHGGSFDAVGAGLMGVPGMVMGRDRTTAWSFTNNACSLRDMYQERHPDGNADAYDYGGEAVEPRRETVRIDVNDGDPVSFEIERTTRGPVIDEILPRPARATGPVSMRWLGAEACTWPKALLGLTRAASVGDAFKAVQGWLVPSFGLAIADTEGEIGFIFTGRIPLRSRGVRTYRPGWDPDDRWLGLIPDEGMPQAIGPARGWLTSSNNRPAPDDWPYPQSGTWAEGYRTRRVGRLIEAQEPGTADRTTLTTMHLDVLTPRAEELLPIIDDLLGPGRDERERQALADLRDWDGRATPASRAAAIFEIFFHRWAQAMMGERIDDPALADYLANWGLGLARDLLIDDDLDWFEAGRREAVASATFTETLDEIEAALGPDMEAWSWGALRPMTLGHPLSGIGDLARLLDIEVEGVGGSLATLNNSGFESTRPSGPGLVGSHGWRPSSGAGYRLEVDLGEEPPAAWSVTLESQSAAPGSEHYSDQVDAFKSGQTWRLPLDRDEVERSTKWHQTLVPKDPNSEYEEATDPS